MKEIKERLKTETEIDAKTVKGMVTKTQKGIDTENVIKTIEKMMENRTGWRRTR